MSTEMCQVKAKHKRIGTWMVGVLMKIEGKYMLLLEDDENMNRVHYTDDEMWLSEVYAVEIDENTICRPTGLTDKNGNKIWENDIIARRVFEDEIKGAVTWTDIGFTGFQVKVLFPGGTSFYSMGRGQYDDDESNQCNDEVIGNIFDNPALLS